MRGCFFSETWCTTRFIWRDKSR